MSEIEEVLNAFSKLNIPKGQRELKGDAWARIVAHYAQKHLRCGLKVVGPNVYIEGFPTEFDLLVVRHAAEPREFTARYPPEMVVATIEVKAHGVFGGRNDLAAALGKIKAGFDAVLTRFPHIRCLYVTMQERSRPKGPSSINYLDETRKVLSPHEVFCFQDDLSKEVLAGEWERFVKLLLGLPEREK